MNILDIIGPVMVGPSSSHTAGAARIGQVALKLLGEKVKSAKILLHGSFLATGKGHGTDRALVAGLLGLSVDDRRIPDSFELAGEKGMEFEFGSVSLPDAHPNSVKLEVTSETGRKLELVAASIVGGRIRVCEIDGLRADFSAESPTVVVFNQDRPGCIVKVTSRLGSAGVNIATMQVYRDERGGHAVMVIEVDQQLPEGCIERLEQEEGIEKVIYLCADCPGPDGGKDVSVISGSEPEGGRGKKGILGSGAGGRLPGKAAVPGDLLRADEGHVSGHEGSGRVL